MNKTRLHTCMLRFIHFQPAEKSVIILVRSHVKRTIAVIESSPRRGE